MPRKKQTSVVKAPASVVSRMLAAMFGGPATDDLGSFVSNQMEMDEPNERMRHVRGEILAKIDDLYPWVVDVGREVMGDRTDLQTFLLSYPGSIFVVKDSLRASKDSLWVAVAGPSAMFQHVALSNPMRGLFHVVDRGNGRTTSIIAVQLKSCLN